MKFHEFDLDEELLKAIDDLEFVDCTEVQERALEHTLNWKDVTAQSQTGTGKTAAFLLTIYHHFKRREELSGRQALIVTPTRELAVQIEEEAEKLGKYLPYRVGSIYGGVGYGPQEKMLRENVEIIVGTPGRLIDLSKSGKLKFDNFAMVVIDEADRLFDMGFYPDIRYMLKRTPAKEDRLTMLFSATLNTSVRNISWQYMNDPAEIEVEPEHITVEEVDQVLYHVARDEKTSLLLGILQHEEPENALIFTNTKRAAELVAKKLKGNGYRCEFIMGDVPQRKRLRIINNLKSGEVPFLVATDVAARGLHIEDLDLVVNYDLPEDAESYVHRIGRTARAGKTGKAVSLACERFVFGLENIESFIGFKIPVGDLSDELFINDQSRVSMRDLQYHGDGGSRSGSRDRGAHSPRGKRGDRSRSRSSSRSRGGDRDSRRTGKHSHEGAPRAGTSGGADNAAASEGAGNRGTDERSRKEPVQAKGRRSDNRKSETRKPRRGKPSEARGSSGGGTDRRRPSKSASMQDRLEYYREKYGEDFQPAGESGGSSRSRRSSEGEKSATSRRSRKKTDRGRAGESGADQSRGDKAGAGQKSDTRGRGKKRGGRPKGDNQGRARQASADQGRTDTAGGGQKGDNRGRARKDGGGRHRGERDRAASTSRAQSANKGRGSSRDQSQRERGKTESSDASAEEKKGGILGALSKLLGIRD